MKVQESRLGELATKRDLLETENRLIKWLVTFLLTQTGLIIAIIKFFP
ncbi:MAG: hypothetical protein HQL52_08635 [Magnetococcales bacterium]|nr:hypothetical protein [Magnetococcales bacterium]